MCDLSFFTEVSDVATLFAKRVPRRVSGMIQSVCTDQNVHIRAGATLIPANDQETLYGGFE